MALRFSLATKNAPLGSRARAEQDAKDREESEARKRVLGEYLEEHGGSDNDTDSNTKDGHNGQSDAAISIPKGAKRHFAGGKRSTKSGPGTLEEETSLPLFRPNSRWAPAPPNYTQPSYVGKHAEDLYKTGDRSGVGKSGEDYYKTVVAKVSNLPPGTDEKSVRDLFADYNTLKVVKVEKIPPSGPSRYEQRQSREHSAFRESVAMKVTFDEDADATSLNNAILKMNDKKYLKRGYYLHLDRFLGNNAFKESEKLPFGAQWVRVKEKFAPTAELAGLRARPSQGRDNPERKIITAYPPPDLRTLKLIHQTIEGVLSGGMEFEAALMESDSVQTEERFAWLYDNTHPLHRYYRFRMYQLVTGDHRTHIEIYPGYGEWQGAALLPDEFSCDVKSLKPDDDGLRPAPGESFIHPQRTADPYPGMVDTGNGFMTPKSRTFLIFLLSNLPTSHAKTSDVAAVTTFAIEHVTAGMDEIVDLLFLNVFEPFPVSTTYATWKLGSDHAAPSTRDRVEATLNALRVLSDLSMVCIRHGGKSYKYRAAIGTQLVELKVFEYLERFSTKLGRVTQDVLTKGVQGLIGIWKERALFDPPILKHIDDAFNLPRVERERRKAAEKAAEKAKRARVVNNPNLSGTSQIGGAAEADGDDAVDDNAVDENNYRSETNTSTTKHKTNNIDNTNAEQQDSQAMAITNQLSPPRKKVKTSGEATDLREMSGPRDVAMTVSSNVFSAEEPSSHSGTGPYGVPGETAAARARRMRPKAEDMFASDED
jgi:U2-associated protein SR140